MKTFAKFLLVALPVAVAALLLGRVIWPDMPGMAGPTTQQIPFFIFISALEAISFGLGVAWLLFGLPQARAYAGADARLRLAAFYSITWLLVSWWPHDNMHRVNGMDDFAGLLRIEFIFHFTLIVAGFILATFFWGLMVKRDLVSAGK